MVPRSSDQRSKKEAPQTCAVVSVERTTGPDGAAGDDWYRYVISSPGAPITGYRRGKKRDVLIYLNECTDQLNERLNSAKASRASAGRKPKEAKDSE